MANAELHVSRTELAKLPRPLCRWQSQLQALRCGDQCVSLRLKIALACPTLTSSTRRQSSSPARSRQWKPRPNSTPSSSFEEKTHHARNADAWEAGKGGCVTGRLNFSPRAEQPPRMVKLPTALWPQVLKIGKGITHGSQRQTSPLNPVKRSTVN